MDYSTTQKVKEAAAGVSPALSIGCPIVGFFLSTCAGYVMVSLFIHFVALRKKAKAERKKQLSVTGSIRTKTRGKGIRRLSRSLGYLSISSAIFAFLNCAVDIPSVYLRKTTNHTCKILMTFSFVFYPCGVACVYSFLWARQRVFYSSTTLGLQRNKHLRWLSFAVLPTFLIFILSGLISTVVIYDYQTSSNGCSEVSGNYSPKVVLFVGTLTMQATLLGLFVYPLRQHSEEGQNELPENKLLMSLIQRAFLTTGICVLADTTAFIIIMTRPPDGPVIVVNLIRDGNLLVNVICIICSFADWKDRLCPICRKVNDDIENPKQGRIRLVKSVKSSARVSSKSPYSSQDASQIKENSQVL